MPQPGDHIPRPDLGPHGLAIYAPPECPNGHLLEYPFVSVGWNHCNCRRYGGGHMGWSCLICGWDILTAEHIGENPIPPRPDFRLFGFVLRELRDRGIDPEQPGWDEPLKRNAPPSE